jgi:membrane associated rhomboid family serine protease
MILRSFFGVLPVMIPLTVDVPMKRLPWANWLLIVATIWISIAVPYAPTERTAFFPSNRDLHELSPLVMQRAHFAVYQLVTSLFQHAGLLHLIGNMVFLFVFGNAVNAKLGHVGFLAAYLGIGILTGVAWLVAGHGDALLGASGAIMGMCGMFLVLYPLNGVKVFWDEFEFALIARSWTGELPGWLVVLLYLAFDIWGMIADRNGGIAYISHVVGGLAGVALAITLLKIGWLTPDVGEQTLLQCLAGEGPTESGEAPVLRGRKQPHAQPPGKHQPPGKRK